MCKEAWFSKTWSAFAGDLKQKMLKEITEFIQSGLKGRPFVKGMTFQPTGHSSMKMRFQGQHGNMCVSEASWAMYLCEGCHCPSGKVRASVKHWLLPSASGEDPHPTCASWFLKADTFIRVYVANIRIQLLVLNLKCCDSSIIHPCNKMNTCHKKQKTCRKSPTVTKETGKYGNCRPSQAKSRRASQTRRPSRITTTRNRRRRRASRTSRRGRPEHEGKPKELLGENGLKSKSYLENKSGMLKSVCGKTAVESSCKKTESGKTNTTESRTASDAAVLKARCETFKTLELLRIKNHTWTLPDSKTLMSCKDIIQNLRHKKLHRDANVSSSAPTPTEHPSSTPEGWKDVTATYLHMMEMSCENYVYFSDMRETSSKNTSWNYVAPHERNPTLISSDPHTHTLILIAS